MSYHPAWTMEHETALGEFLANGLSHSQCAAELNEKFGTSYTRNSSIGKAHRLGLTGRIYVYVRRPRSETEATRRAKYERRKERRRIQLASCVMVNLEALRCVEVVPLHKSLIDLGPNDCRYPYGDGPYTFCGHPQMEGRSYCGSHTALSFRRLER